MNNADTPSSMPPRPHRKPGPHTTSLLTPEEFVLAWQRARNVAEVAAASGANVKTCCVRAYTYRRAGVPLKKFSTSHNKIDMAALTSAVKEAK